MDTERPVDGHEVVDDEPLPTALVGRRRRSRTGIAGTLEVRPMAADSELRLKSALQRVIAAIVRSSCKAVEGDGYGVRESKG